MKRHLKLAAFGIVLAAATTLPVSAQIMQPYPGPSAPGTANPNSAVGPQGIAPPVSGNFGLTQSPGGTSTPGYAPGAGPTAGVGGGAGPALSFGAPFSGTGHGINQRERTAPELGGLGGAPTIMPSVGSSGTAPPAGSPGPSMGTTPASGSLAPGAGAGR